jgi:hypothetical protein
MKIIVKSAKMKYFSKEEGKFFNFSPTIRRIKNIETQVGFLETDSKSLVNELKLNELFLFVEGEEPKPVETPKSDTSVVAPKKENY